MAVPTNTGVPTIGQSHVIWDDEMDKVLCEVLVEEVTKNGKKDKTGGPKAPSVNRAAQVVNERFERYTITTKNIYNRLRVLRIRFNLARAAINASGFGIVWDGTNKYLDADEVSWKEYCVGKDKAVASLRHTFFPMYEALWLLYGDETASGKGTFHPLDPGGISGEHSGTQANLNPEDVEEVAGTEDGESTPDVASRKKTRKDTITKALESNSLSISRIADEMTLMRTTVFDRNAQAGLMWEELNKLEGLTMDRKLTLSILFSKDPNQLSNFLKIPDDYKLAFVTLL